MSHFLRDSNREQLEKLINLALIEDVGSGDITTNAIYSGSEKSIGMFIAKQDGVVAGIEVASIIATMIDPEIHFHPLINDGDRVSKGDHIAKIDGRSDMILTAERIILNFMQRMSGIATYTKKLTDMIDGTGVKLLDTRKTTPGIRYMEKWAVRIGGGYNHRYALYDMIMLKDNHIDYAGGISKAISKTHQYLEKKRKNLKIVIEVRNSEELKEVIACGGVDRIMLDNFSPDEIINAIALIPSNIETEASGGITEETILAYAKTGVDFISVGALTHSVDSLDLSLKAYFN